MAFAIASCKARSDVGSKIMIYVYVKYLITINIRNPSLCNELISAVQLDPS
jgi:hypothetical protein